MKKRGQANGDTVSKGPRKKRCWSEKGEVHGCRVQREEGSGEKADHIGPGVSEPIPGQSE